MSNRFMHRRFLVMPVLLSGLVLLSACQNQGPNPYAASSAPLPPAPMLAPIPTPTSEPITTAPPIVAPSAYPTAPPGFSRYRSWSWAGDRMPVGSAWGGSDMVDDAVGGGLEQRGLRPTAPGRKADLRIGADVHLETRQHQVQENYYNGSTYYSRGPYRRGYVTESYTPVLQTYEERVLVVHIDMFDGRTGELVWSNTAEEVPADGTEVQRSAVLRAMVQKVLSTYPPA